MNNKSSGHQFFALDTFTSPEFVQYKSPNIQGDHVVQSLQNLSNSVLKLGQVKQERKNKSDFLTGQKIALDKDYRDRYKKHIQNTEERDPAKANLLRGSSPFLKDGYFKASAQNYAFELGTYIQKSLKDNATITIDGKTHNIHTTDDMNIIAQWFDEQADDLKKTAADHDWDHEAASPYLTPLEQDQKQRFLTGMQKNILQAQTHKRYNESFKMLDHFLTDLQQQPGIKTASGSTQMTAFLGHKMMEEYNSLLEEGMNKEETEKRLLTWISSLLEQKGMIELVDVFDHLDFGDKSMIKALKQDVKKGILDHQIKQERFAEVQAEKAERQTYKKLLHDWHQLAYEYNDYVNNPDKPVSEFIDRANIIIDGFVSSGLYDQANKFRAQLERMSFTPSREAKQFFQKNMQDIRRGWAQKAIAGTFSNDDQAQEEHLDQLDGALANNMIGYAEYNQLSSHLQNMNDRHFTDLNHIANFYKRDFKARLKSMPVLSHSSPNIMENAHHRLDTFIESFFMDMQGSSDDIPTKKEMRDRMGSYVDFLIRDITESMQNETMQISDLLSSSSIHELSSWAQNPDPYKPIFKDVEAFKKLLSPAELSKPKSILNDMAQKVDMDIKTFIQQQLSLYGMTLKIKNNDGTITTIGPQTHEARYDQPQ